MKRIIIAHLASIVAGVIAISLVLSLAVQVKFAFDNVTSTADDVFTRIERLVKQNDEERSVAKTEHRDSCLTHARAAASVIQASPEMVHDFNALCDLAQALGVDELHVFDTTGTIISGTTPQYYGYNFDSGEQMAFFKPLIEGGAREMVQEIVPNTAEGKDMQYAAAWCHDGSYIVQIGMEPRRLLTLLDSYDISHVFSMVTVASRTTVFAVGLEDGLVKGSNDVSHNGADTALWGVPVQELARGSKTFFATIDGTTQFCVARPMPSGDIAVVRAVSLKALVEPVWSNTLMLLGYLLAVATIMMFLIVRFLDRRIVSSIESVNADLDRITRGNHDVTLSVSSTPEFVELSEHVNAMVRSITAVTGKISVLLEGMETAAGVFEYASRMQRVRATSRLHEAFGMSRGRLDRMLKDPAEFMRFVESVQANPVGENESICQVPGALRYVYIETVIHDGVLTGVVFDMTEESIEKRALQRTSNFDYLTDLGNRRRFFDDAFKVMAQEAQHSYGFVAVIDADDLKVVNDEYGHGEGDRYLKALADFLRAHCASPGVLARMGGDEFALLRCGFATHEEAQAAVDCLVRESEEVVAELPDKTKIPVRFSVGVAYFEPGATGVNALLDAADMEMYRVKKEHKAAKAAEIRDTRE